MPKVGSVNHTEPSDLTTTSLGELSGLCSKRLQITVIEPSCSVRVTRRMPCSQVTSRPWRSRVLPLALLEGLRKIVVSPVSSSHLRIRLLGMSLHNRHRRSPSQTGPSLHRQPVYSRSTAAFIGGRSGSKRGSRVTIAGSG